MKQIKGFSIVEVLTGSVLLGIVSLAVVKTLERSQSQTVDVRRLGNIGRDLSSLGLFLSEESTCNEVLQESIRSIPEFDGGAEKDKLVDQEMKVYFPGEYNPKFEQKERSTEDTNKWSTKSARISAINDVQVCQNKDSFDEGSTLYQMTLTVDVENPDAVPNLRTENYNFNVATAVSGGSEKIDRCVKPDTFCCCTVDIVEDGDISSGGSQFKLGDSGRQSSDILFKNDDPKIVPINIRSVLYRFELDGAKFFIGKRRQCDEKNPVVFGINFKLKDGNAFNKKVEVLVDRAANGLCVPRALDYEIVVVEKEDIKTHYDNTGQFYDFKDMKVVMTWEN